MYAFASNLEKCYHLDNLNLVFSHWFLPNLVQSWFRDQKILCSQWQNVSRRWIHHWIQLQESYHIECMGGSLEFFFDNTGKYVVKNYRINLAGRKRADIIITAIQISPSSVHHIQADISLKPQKNHFGWKITSSPPEDKRCDFKIWCCIPRLPF